MRLNMLDFLIKEHYKVIVDDNLTHINNSESLDVIKEFVDFCCDELNIENNFLCKIVSDRAKYGIKTTAFYLHEKNLLVIYGKNRMLGDILRSVAHELTHKQQFDQGRIKGEVQDVGGYIENEANAMAGILVKSFIKNHPYGEKLFN